METTMDFETVLLKAEPENDIINATGDIHCDTTHTCIKTGVNMQAECSSTYFNNERINKSTMNFSCKKEPVDSFNKSPKMEIEDIFDEHHQVDLAKLKELLNQSKNSPECSNVKLDDIVFGSNRFSGKGLNIKREEEEYDISEDPLQISESNNLILKENQEKEICYDTFGIDQDVQEFSEISDIDEKINISEVTLQASEYNNSDNPRTNPEEEVKSKIHKCNNCSFETTLKSSLRRHINSFHNEHRMKVKCQFCEKSFSLKKSLDGHLWKLHKEELKTDSVITSNIYKCKICSYKTTLNSHFNVHINSKHNVSKTCKFCHKTFALNRLLVEHLIKHHKNGIKNDEKYLIESNLHTCEICAYETSDENDFNTHMNSTHNKQRIKINCQHCDKSFTRKSSLDDHMVKQHKKKIESKIYRCKICSYQSTLNYKLTRHLDSIHNEHRSKINCKLCDKPFTLKRSLDDHLLNFHKDEINSDREDLITSKIHMCKICSYKTTNKTRLTTHMIAMHNHQRTCQFCDKTFTLKSSLDDHLLKHHKEELKGDMKHLITSKIHVCKFCSYETSQINCLKVHIFSNHDEQRVKSKCEFCDKSFAIRKSLDDHLIKQHKSEIENDLEKFITSKIYKCSNCALKTTFKQNLDKHKCQNDASQIL